MSQPVRRVELPSGGWWKILTRPRWKHVRGWLLDRDASSRTDRQDSLVEQALVALTVAWSFCEPVSLESLGRREPGDVLAMMKVMEREIVPLWGRDRPRVLGEELFTGLVGGRIPAMFAEAHIMAQTGWSWATLQETPADVVEKMAIYLAVRQASETGATIEYLEGEYGR